MDSGEICHQRQRESTALPAIYGHIYPPAGR